MPEDGADEPFGGEDREPEEQEPEDGKTRGGVSNDFSGAANTVFQIGNVNGGFTINGGLGSGPDGDGGRPSTVPAAPLVFVNRNDVFDGIARTLHESTGTGVFVFEGPLGVGKSSLLRKAAERLQERFPGGVLHYDYTPVEGRRRPDPDQAVTDFLRSLGVKDAFLPETFRGRVDEFLTRTARSPVLVVVDGAQEPAQVRPLIPGGRGALLAAGDGPSLAELVFDPQGAVHHVLEPLGEEEARELLQRKCPRLDPGDPGIPRLIEACDGLPLALVMVAARIRAQDDTAALLADLGSEKRRLAAIGYRGHTLSATFGTTYKRLSGPAAALYRALGEWPGEHFDRYVAEALVPDGGADSLLAELADAGVLEPASEGVYRFRHPLLVADARKRGAETDAADVRRAALGRMAAGFLGRLAFADVAVMGTRTRVTDVGALTEGMNDPFQDGGRTRTRALEWLEGERRTLTGLVMRSSDLGLDDVSWQVAEMATALYMNVRFVQDWVETGLAGAAAAGRAGRSDAEMRLRTAVSRPLADLGRRDEALRQLDRVFEIAREVGDVMLEASAYEFYGRLLQQTDIDAAITAFNRSEDLCASLGDDANARRGAALAAFYRGRARLDAGRMETARKDLEDAHSRLLGLVNPDVRMAARAEAALGRLHLKAERHAEALRTLAKAADALEECQSEYHEAEVREDLAAASTALNLDAETERHLRRALEIYRKGGSPRARDLEQRLSDDT
ncbi:tetratricopeptide repeat protein [Nocardiopsis sp. RSe5-2]|uniref:Tetratricopeptide repeat protein n=1 Tax=Nocardiopsis endophytica TaxID=3018445 RepID=A0ABT4U407_9ACTN|nr:AAA family ATPase [Nocardiopsis endophytica]MDA2811694.1 tetratricopeptide repeat protein [Nocardiopsis endophytica]